MKAISSVCAVAILAAFSLAACGPGAKDGVKPPIEPKKTWVPPAVDKQGERQPGKLVTDKPPFKNLSQVQPGSSAPSAAKIKEEAIPPHFGRPVTEPK